MTSLETCESPGKHMILIVEDDDANREFLRVLLENESFVVATARDGEEALAWLRGHPTPDLVLLDLEMPRMNGWELAGCRARCAAAPHAYHDADRTCRRNPCAGLGFETGNSRSTCQKNS